MTRSHEESYCDDEDQCTRVDECVDGVCKGTPFTCLNFAHTDNLWENCEVRRATTHQHHTLLRVA